MLRDQMRVLRRVCPLQSADDVVKVRLVKRAQPRLGVVDRDAVKNQQQTHACSASTARLVDEIAVRQRDTVEQRQKARHGSVTDRAVKADSRAEQHVEQKQ
jgi:hypothetical protein